jgi:hypothetical protein
VISLPKFFALKLPKKATFFRALLDFFIIRSLKLGDRLIMAWPEMGSRQFEHGEGVTLDPENYDVSQFAGDGDGDDVGRFAGAQANAGSGRTT